MVRVVDSLEHPWAVDGLPDGRMLITERPGQMILVDGEETTTLDNVPDGWAQNQGGMLDVRVASNYEETGWIYFSYSKKEGDKGARCSRGPSSTARRSQTRRCGSDCPRPRPSA